ncbi:MAG: ATP-binding protein [Clostridia bacterium]|nr:ATP-binding protein [Clostridia bacterium]
MGYNRENYKRIREEYQTKYLRARDAADARRAELHMQIPAVAEIDRELAATGLEIMRVTLTGGETREQKLADIRARNGILQDARAELLRAAGYPADYSSVHYECEACSDSGYVDGKMCACMRRALTMAGYETSGIGTLLQSQTFETFSLEYYRQNPAAYEAMARNLDVMKRFADHFSEDNMRNLLLMGSTGLGKTHLSSAVARRVIDRGFDVQYVTAVGMLADFEYQRFGNSISGDEGENVARYYDCDLLIIDDLGTEMINQFTLSCIYNVINIRLTRKKSTIISTNFSQKELREKYWDRITSRLLGEYYPLIFSGTDVRRVRLAAKQK